MWPSAALALARLQMNRPKRNGPPEKPEGINGEHEAMWHMLDWLASEVRDGRKETRQFAAALFVAALVGFITLVVK